MRFADCLSGIRGRMRASCSAPPSRTISKALFIANASLPAGTPTTFTPSPSAMRTPMPPRSEISSGVGTCPFGGNATVSLGLMAIPISHSSCWRRGTTLAVSGVISDIPMLMSSR